jgi:hypothetical protein
MNDLDEDERLFFSGGKIETACSGSAHSGNVKASVMKRRLSEIQCLSALHRLYRDFLLEPSHINTSYADVRQVVLLTIAFFEEKRLNLRDNGCL